MDTEIARASALGDVYLWHGGAHINAGRGLSVPIVYQSSPAMRHDILVTDALDLTTIGVPWGRWLIRPAEMHGTPGETQPRTGSLPDHLRERMRAALHREQGDRDFERRFKPTPAAEWSYG